MRDTAPTKVRYIIVNNEGVRNTAPTEVRYNTVNNEGVKRYCSYRGTVHSLDIMKEPVILLLHMYCSIHFKYGKMSKILLQYNTHLGTFNRKKDKETEKKQE